ncbi:putative transmembrane protein [Paraburkholderia sabiae]|uniref:DUF3426 domain-containing protein n=1 Tax=Paraburkholderia sabiae TaxID=273251 RepID=UPI001CB640E9|nr:DUF3426 domain-containing protein [Paraburkholderia sabiae]CAG9211078.1 putative transmembrane protein [Paraburkholderia sabiae]
MLLATRCPFCETVFRLQPEQLTLRRGLVRCGHCKEVFDASSSLFDVSNGVSIDKAKPVTIDDVTAYTLGSLANGSAEAAVRETKPVAPPVVTQVQEAAPTQPVETQNERPAAAEPESNRETARAEQAPAEPPVETEAAAQPSPAADAQHAPSEHEPDFRAEAWNPWAPAPDASIDRRIRHNASTIPFNPVTIPRSAQPPLTLELTESEPMNLEKAIARNPVERDPVEPHIKASVEQQVEQRVEPTVAVQTEPKVGPTAEAQAQPRVEEPAVAPAQSKAEPAFDGASARDFERDMRESTTHAWREPESLRESAETQRGQAAPKPEAKAPLHDPFDDDLREPPRDKPSKSAFENDDRTVSPSADHAGQPREREPYFGAPSAEPDLEPRFGADAGARDQYGEPYRTPFAAPHGGDDDAFAVTREPREPEAKRLMWHIGGGVAGGLLACLLLVQLAWWQRESVMVAWPDSQALFVKACSNLGCKIEPPRDIDGLLVEPSDLRQVDGPHKLELKMPLRNRFDLALAYPAVELTLLDENNNIAVRRVLWPQDYVKPGTPIAAGLPARTTQTMIVRLDTGDTVASNFRVQIFYP